MGALEIPKKLSRPSKGSTRPTAKPRTSTGFEETRSLRRSQKHSAAPKESFRIPVSTASTQTATESTPLRRAGQRLNPEPQQVSKRHAVFVGPREPFRVLAKHHQRATAESTPLRRAGQRLNPEPQQPSTRHAVFVGPREPFRILAKHSQRAYRDRPPRHARDSCLACAT